MIMKSYEEQYLNLLEKTLTQGVYTEDRTGTGCYKLFSETMKIDLKKGFPLLTTKKINFDNIIGELLWFLNGRNDLPSLRHYQGKQEGAHTIWSDDFEKYWERIETVKVYPCLERKLEVGGLVYGKQLRNYNEETLEVDQLEILLYNIEQLKENPKHPMGRRLKCEFWNPVEHLKVSGDTAALPACHTGFQIVIMNGVLNLHFNMRANDVFLGAPYNLASYAVLAHILARITKLEVGELSYQCSDIHLYSNHTEQARLQLERCILTDKIELILPEINNISDLLSLTCKDFEIHNYNPHGFIKAQQAS